MVHPIIKFRVGGNVHVLHDEDWLRAGIHGKQDVSDSKDREHLDDLMIQREVSETDLVCAAHIEFPMVTQVLIDLRKQMLIKYVPFQLFFLL